MELWAIHLDFPHSLTLRLFDWVPLAYTWRVARRDACDRSQVAEKSGEVGSITPQRKPFADGAFSVVRVLSGQELIALSIAPCTVETYGRAWR
jgi:hypothetical protein